MQKDLFKIEEKGRITVGRLKKMLEGYSDDTEITFGSTIKAIPLVFYRVKRKGNDLVQIELNEVLEDDV